MFAYCGNNPIAYTDTQGQEREYFRTTTGLYGGGRTSDAGAGIGDLLWPFAYLIDAITTRTKSEESEKDTVITTAKTVEPDDKAIFTADPYAFAPNNLEMHVIVAPGTGSNGGIIKWELPGTKITIFEWNEDWKNGAHYHTLKIEWKNKHYGPHHPIGSEVPEPWQSTYFSG